MMGFMRSARPTAGARAKEKSSGALGLGEPGRGRRGLTIIEFTVASMISVIVVLALGRIVLANKRGFDWNVDKTVLQQNASESLERMARAVRASQRLVVTSPSAFSTYDETGALTCTFMRTVASGTGTLRENGAALTPRACTAFTVTPDEDTTSVSIELQLADNSGNAVALATRAAVRNRHFQF
ncbi:MAG: hypothetical protein KA123_01255 [Candidatus Eisenbacteria bacterium]|nr:hypothetical protein [Candidatus Eisenbacteria bacterium]